MNYGWKIPFIFHSVKCLQIKLWCIMCRAAVLNARNEPHRFYEPHHKCTRNWHWPFQPMIISTSLPWVWCFSWSAHTSLTWGNFEIRYIKNAARLFINQKWIVPLFKLKGLQNCLPGRQQHPFLSFLSL